MSTKMRILREEKKIAHGRILCNVSFLDCAASLNALQKSNRRVRLLNEEEIDIGRVLQSLHSSFDLNPSNFRIFQNDLMLCLESASKNLKSQFNKAITKLNE